jgi:hypothetical protein
MLTPEQNDGIFGPSIRVFRFISVANIDSDWLKTPASFYRCVQDQESGNPGADFRTPQPRAGLTLDGSGHETTHVVTLQQQEQDQARDGHHHDASLRGTVVDGTHRLLPQVGHRERQGLLSAVG